MSAADSTSRGSARPIRSVSGFILGIFTRNLVSKVAALALAILVWITVRQDLTGTGQFEARVVPDLAPDLMLLADPPATATVEFEGPTSEIDQLRRNPEEVEIILKVTDDDMNDDLVATRSFNAERGNIGHNYGEQVRITQLLDDSIRLRVAVRGRERKPVGAPTAEDLPEEWKARFEVLTPEVLLTGPQRMLNEILEVETRPISASRLLQGVEGDEYTTTVELKLTEAAIADRIRLPDGERIECRVSFTRSLTPREYDIPFTVFFERADWPVVATINETNLVRRVENGNFTIRLEFTGSRTDLARVQEALASGWVRAYVRALDLSFYAEGVEGRGSAPNVHVELPTELWDRVTFRPPPREEIDIEVLKRAKQPEDGR